MGKNKEPQFINIFNCSSIKLLKELLNDRGLKPDQTIVYDSTHLREGTKNYVSYFSLFTEDDKLFKINMSEAFEKLRKIVNEYSERSNPKKGFEPLINVLLGVLFEQDRYNKEILVKRIYESEHGCDNIDFMQLSNICIKIPNPEDEYELFMVLNEFADPRTKTKSFGAYAINEKSTDNKCDFQVQEYANSFTVDKKFDFGDVDINSDLLKVSTINDATIYYLRDATNHETKAN